MKVTINNTLDALKDDLWLRDDDYFVVVSQSEP